MAIAFHILLFTDSLGRETNSVRAVMFNGSRDPAYEPLATRTEYPFGTGGYSVTTDPLGVATVTRTRYVNNAKVRRPLRRASPTARPRPSAAAR